MDKQQAEREFEKDRRIKVAGFNGCKKAKDGLYCQSCVAQATNYTYSGEQDRRKSQHIYKRHLPDVNFEYWYTKNCTVDLDLTSAKIGWQASRSALMPALVEAREALEHVTGLNGEINPSNYNHDDVCHLNAQFVEALLTADKALSRINAILGEKK